MKNNLAPAIALGFAFLAMTSCSKDPEPTVIPPDANTIIGKYLNLNINQLPNYANPGYPVHYSNNILANDNAPSINRVTDAGAVLGRVLFYDKNLSRNNSVACASCHIQEKGFTDDQTFSEGFDGGLTGAHSMRLGNTNFYTGDRMFWDKRAIDLEDQSTMPIKDHTEMGFDDSVGGIDSLLRKMKALEYYPILFEQAFGTTDITEDRMQRAIAQFVRSMVSTDSKFDRGFAQVFNPAAPGAGDGAPFPNFTPQENQGKALFLSPPNAGGAGCAGCHQPPTFALNANSLSNGLDLGETTVFKAPTLKNIGLTGPYMHDGRFATLEEVVEHYNSGIQPGPALDNRLRNPVGQPLRLNLTANQKQALVAFLQTLSDETLITDSRFADPFK
ncbi:MAG: cytochrome-c peroxidase [Bacteroidetes bacterium]|nr:MAG: cytochrome-c peroxidase [Bacteroidota bacterium]